MDQAARRRRRSEIAARLTQLLEEWGQPQRSIAKTLGKAPSSVTGWKSGRAQPSLESLAELLELTGRSADWLLGTEELAESVAEVGAEYGRPLPDQRAIEGVIESKALSVQLNEFLARLDKRVRAIERAVERTSDAVRRTEK